MEKQIPGHIKSAFKSIERFLPVIDIVIELLDARMPISSRMPGLVNKLKKPSIIVLGKADLADAEVTQQWEKKFQNEDQPCISIDAKSSTNIKDLIKKILLHSFSSTSNNDDNKTGRKTKRLMIVGIPNVGKSTLINALAGRKAAKTANIPGVTRNIQWVKLDGKFELLDLPGILDFGMLKRGQFLRIINTLPGPDDDPIFHANLLLRMLAAVDKDHVLPRFSQSAESHEQYLEIFASQMNYLLHGGKLDMRRAAIDLLKRFQGGKFGRITLESPDFTDWRIDL